MSASDSLVFADPHTLPAQIHPCLFAMHDLAASVRKFQADVVVLVARKMPHLAEVLKLDFGRGALLMSDTAIAYAHRNLRGMRVAVVDDVVNVGSTIDRARRAAEACGASRVEMFSLGRKLSGRPPDDIHYVYTSALSDQDYQTHVAAVPRAIQALTKPYDLAFPTIPCKILPPLRNANDLLHELTFRCGANAVRNVSSDGFGDLRKQLRYTIVHPHPTGNFKVRLYIDVNSRLCNLVPLAIPAVLSARKLAITSLFAERVLHTLSDSAAGAPEEASLWPGETQVRAALFARSLELGLSCLKEWSDLLAIVDPAIFSRHPAASVFGPTVYAIEAPTRAEEVSPPHLQQECTEGDSMPRESEFLRRFPCERLIQAARQSIPTGGRPTMRDDMPGMYECTVAFNALFAELATIVGAHDPSQYQLDWPYTREEVEKRPYLRLRVGPTFRDVVQLLGRALYGTVPQDEQFFQLVSELLDRAIDCGSVVPAFAHANGFYRIYRRGESPGIDQAVQRLQHGIYCYGRPLSSTRASKIEAILAFSPAFHDKLQARPIQRGIVGTMPATILDKPDMALVTFARNTGRLRTL